MPPLEVGELTDSDRILLNILDWLQYLKRPTKSETARLLNAAHLMNTTRPDHLQSLGPLSLARGVPSVANKLEELLPDERKQILMASFGHK